MDWQRLAPSGTRKQMAVTALAGLLLGLGGVTAGTSLVQASERGGLFDFFESIFRGPAPEPRVVPVRRRPAHYASLPDAHRVTATRVVRQTPRPREQARLLRPVRHARVRAPVTPVAIKFGYGLVMASCLILWFVGVSLFMTTPAMRLRFTRISHWIDRASGMVFIALGLKLATEKAA